MKGVKVGFLADKLLLVVACLLSASVLAESNSKTWTFDLPLPATYKVQVEDRVEAPKQANVPITYAIQVGGKTISRQLDLIANQVFIPLITDVEMPGALQVVISGLSAVDLNRTNFLRLARGHPKASETS